MIFELTKKICSAYGPSGRENTVSEVIKAEIKDYVDEVYNDTMGNLIARKKGTGKKIMLSAHMDSIGFAVSFVEDEGFLRFGAIGGLSKEDVANVPVKFENGVRGVVSYGDEKKWSELTLSDFYIDIGAKNKEEALKLVRPGDFAVYANEHFTQGDIIVGPYMDDRIACVVQILAIKEAKPTENDVYYVFSTQEEVGLRGATTAAYAINPDYGIATDVTCTGDTPETKMKMEVKLGEGPCVKIMDRSVICNKEVKDILYKAGADLDMKLQEEVLLFGGTDTAAMQRTREGALAGAISIGTRYIHTPCEMVSITDVTESAKLLAHAITLI